MACFLIKGCNEPLRDRNQDVGFLLGYSSLGFSINSIVVPSLNSITYHILKGQLNETSATCSILIIGQVLLPNRPIR